MSRNIYQYDPRFGYTHIPGLKARIDHEGGGYLVQTNEAGFRSQRQLETPKPAGSFRILVFGDSFTAGEGVSNRDRFSDVLETLLPGTEVYNFGLSGTGTDQQYLIWRELAKPLDHDLMVIAIQVENIRRNAARFRLAVDREGNSLVMAKPYFDLAADGHLELHHVPCPKETTLPDAFPEDQRQFVDWSGHRGQNVWLRKMVNRLGPKFKDLVQRVTRFNPLPEYDDPNCDSWRLMKAILRQWDSELEHPAIVFPIPLYQFVEETASPRGVQARFAELSDLQRSTVYDPLADLRAYSATERRSFRFASDAHPTPAGHRALAESLAKPIRTMIEAQATAAKH